jgi:hypothetical protein
MMSRVLRRVLLLVPALALVAGFLAPSKGDEPEPLEKGHVQIAVPFLKARCFTCHDDKEQAGDLILLGLADPKAPTERRALWRRVYRQVSTKEMPPDDQPQPTPQERAAFVAWVKRALGPDEVTTADPGRVTVRRLNRAEYDYTVQDLLHVRPRPKDEFPQDDTGYGFDRIGDVLSLPPLLLERYMAAAEQIASEAILDWKPLQLRQASSDLVVKNTSSGDRGSFKVLYSNGRAEWAVKVPWPGEYTLRVRAYGEQAGSEPAKMGLSVDGRTVETFDVEAVESKPGVFEKKATLRAGERKIATSFLNDYYKPDDPDPKNRDRNLAVEWIELAGPGEPPPLPWAHDKWFSRKPPEKAKSGDRGAEPRASRDARLALARELLAPVASRAWRRPVKPDELDRLASLVELALKENETWERGLQLALEAILVSPSFVFRLELDAPKSGANEILDEHALATRLAYFVWSSLPDDELMAEADKGSLKRNLVKQTKRLLADPRASRLTEQFAVQWLHLRRLDTFVADKKSFPAFDDHLRASARAETQRLFETVLRENRSVRDLVDPDFTFVDERLAKLYGIPGIDGDELRRVPAPEERRGLLGQASVLMATSNPTRTSPVKRGRWVLEVLLDDPPPPPLPGADSLKDKGTELEAKTLRERLEVHRAKKECAQCHAKMDALGFSLERFDAIGRVREKDGDQPIDDEGAYPGGEKIKGARGLREWLSKRTPRLARALAKKLMIFGLGRGPIAADDEALDALVDRCAPDYRLQDLIVEVVKLDAFQQRRADARRVYR